MLMSSHKIAYINVYVYHICGTMTTKGAAFAIINTHIEAET